MLLFTLKSISPEEQVMNLAELSPNYRIEMHSEEETTLHFGRISLHMPINDLMTIGAMFNPRERELESDEICSVELSEAGKFLFTYRSIVFTLCAKSLSKLAKLVEQSIREFHMISNREKAESLEEIESILSGIENM